jgi:transcriptional regulator with XRE-family HTH domain
MKFRNLRTQSFASIRERLGLSQSQLAIHLGIAKSTLGMAETGRRSLPIAALLKFGELEIRLSGEEVMKTPEPINVLEKFHSTDMSTLRELQCDIQVQKLTMKLERMIMKFQKLQVHLQALDTILQAAYDPGNRQMLFMEMHREQIKDQITTCNVAEQLMVRNRIAVLSAESNLSRSVRQKFG